MITWPPKYEVLGTDISATSYDQATDILIDAARRKLCGTVAHAPVHLLMAASRDPHFRSRVNEFDIVAPDGQPVRWALRWMHGVRLADRVYGPELMLRLCQRAAKSDVSIYLYGSNQDVVEKLRVNLLRRIPSLAVVGHEAPPFRALTPEEDKQVVQRINGSGAAIVFIGLGCPTQELFAYEHRGTIQALQVCVGAAFDFHSGNKKMAPSWMQRIGIEWIYRLISEPRRLWRRYLYTNSLFVWCLGKHFILRGVQYFVPLRSSR